VGARIAAPSPASSSHLCPHYGAPLSELSWSSSLAVVAVSFSGLFTVIALMLACLCCKKGGIGFKEFENAEGEEYAAGFSAQGSPATGAQNGPDVYVLPLTEVSLPMAKQPGRSVQLLKSTDLGRHSLLYLEEVGHGWFGKVSCWPRAGVGGEGTGSQRGRVETCFSWELPQPWGPLSYLKGYLRSCRVAESLAPDPLTLQRMACELASGVLHLHRHNYVHRWQLPASRPARWAPPDGHPLRRSLGVSIWELFELGAQPYPHHSDRQVLAYAVREQQLKLPKPQLQLTLSDRWYEVMQFCWLQPEQRPTAEEVHLLLSYLCAKGATEAEEEFERRWRSLRPGGGGTGPGLAGLALGGAGELAAASSFPLLEQFAGDGFQADGDDVLTVTETSRGLNFEYKWEAGRGAEAFLPPGGAASPSRTARLQELCAPDGAPPGVVPVLSAHSPSVGSEYFIRLEEPTPATGHDPDCAGCTPSPHAVGLLPDGGDRENDSEGSAAASLAMEPLLGPVPSPAGSWGHCDYSLHGSHARDPPCSLGSPSPGTLMLAEPREEDSDWGAAAFCPPFLEDPLGTSPSGSSRAQPSPGGEVVGEAEACRAAQHRHWSSNVSANNNSGSRVPGSWDTGYVGGCMGCCPSTEHTGQAVPELGRPLALEDTIEPLLGLQGVSSGQELSRCLGLRHLRPAGSLPPVTCLLPSSETQAAISGGDHPQTEPRLAEEAEGSARPQRPLPSLPAPSPEGALLPAEEAGALASLPALPMPAGSWETAPEVAPSLDSCPGSPELEATVSEDEDEDVTEATSGIFTDASSDGPPTEKLDVMPAFRSLQKQVGTPDSVDSLDIPSSASDGGGLEVFSPSVIGTPGGQPRALDSGYDTENYESPEFVLKEAHEPCEPEVFGELVSEGEGPGPETQLSTSLGGLSEKNPYRDSAYFSDLDTEPESTSGPQEKGGGALASRLELDLESPGLPSAQPSPESGLPQGAQGTGPMGVPPLLLPLPEDPSPEPSSTCPESPRLEPPWPQGPAGGPAGPSPERSEVFLLTPVPLSSESHGPDLQEAAVLLSGPAQQERTGGPSTPRTPLCLALPGLPAAPEGRSEEEEEDSEDSDESDEELRCYSVQEPSEESEEEAPPVPVVVAESQSARNLRGLLKMPSLLSEAFCEDLERKKKAVSFFDDVTVYLFDQESPTRELGEPLPDAKEPEMGVAPTRQLGRPAAVNGPRAVAPAGRLAPWLRMEVRWQSWGRAVSGISVPKHSRGTSRLPGPVARAGGSCKEA
uniref:Apoptosis associated tyrosine kinase n=1 Tax=Neovison vison TaxID=452646 RepID=A0A8C7BMW4_NEOVI